MFIRLNKYQEALLRNFWTMTIVRGLIKMHYYWERGIYKYCEDTWCAEEICKKHRIKLLKEGKR